MKKKLILFHLFLFGIISAHVSAFDNEDYQKYAEEIRQSVWSQDLPEFQSPRPTDSFKDESAVILALYDELLLNQKTRLRGLGFNLYTVKELTNNRLQRMLIQINDEASLKEFSEFDYKTYDRNHIFGIGNEEMRNVLGVRIFKRDGSMREISTDDYMTATEGKRDNEERHKLAVPGLEIGDILDIFTFSMEQIRQKNIDPITYSFVKAYPVLSYRIHCEIDPKLTVQYRTLNGAPDFEVSSNEDKDIVLDVYVKDIKEKAPELWYNAMKQSPVTLLLIESKNINTFVPPSVKKGGLQANPDATEIQKDDWEYWNFFMKNYSLNWYRGASQQVKETLKKHKGSTEEEMADEIYQWLEMRTLDTYLSQQSPTQFIRVFCSMLDKAKIPYEKGITTHNFLEPIDQLSTFHNTTWFVRLLSGKMYFAPAFAMVPGEIPSTLQGRKAIISGRHTTGPYSSITLPSNDASKNVEDIRIHATINGTTLGISREVCLSGTLREETSLYLPTRAQLLDSFKETFDGINGREDLYTQKDSKRIITEQNVKDKETQDEYFKNDVKMFHGEQPLATKSYHLTSVGNYPDHPVLCYDIEYEMGGYVKKAGNNLVVSVGSMTGDPLTIEGNNRKRTVGICRTSPRTFSRSVILDIPSGYSISEESLRPLYQKIDNASATFVSEAVMKGQQLCVNLHVVFKNVDEPVEHWQHLLDVADAWKNFHSQQIVLRNQ
ncbi:MAG: hypothetical protein J5682_03065 [Prevotella sp.]|nr:hypothetical protein [Prevotella sp.]